MSGLASSSVYFPLTIRNFVTVIPSVGGVNAADAGPVTFRHARGRFTILQIIRRDAAGQIVYRFQMSFTGGENETLAQRIVSYINESAFETFPAVFVAGPPIQNGALFPLGVAFVPGANAFIVTTRDGGVARQYTLTFFQPFSILPTIQRTAGDVLGTSSLEITASHGYFG